MYKIYADGAVSNNGYGDSHGGYAWALICDDECVDYASYGVAPATNNYCEMMAIIDACEEILPKLDAFDNVVIYSDSGYCINCYAQSWWKGWIKNGWVNAKKEPVKNRELWERMIPFFQDPRFQFVKVKGHAGDKWNEFVDKLAVAAKGV